jgi:hypothetical protein
MKDFKMPMDKRMAMAKELSRLAQKGVISRLERGKYYKPRQTTYGELKPSESEVINSLVGASNGYLSGVGMFNSMGLTSQVASTVEIAVSDFRPPKEIAGLRIKYRKSMVKILSENREVLPILDAFRYINKIPDTTPDNSLKVLIDIVKSLSNAKKRQLLESAVEYNPATRALIGAVFELNFPTFTTENLYSSLNPLSFYRLGISHEVLPNKSKWRIE